ncbi:hypothetical protein [uncultured Microbulbifer sp.]|uniref:hypothetical protein n=1 Tax=uncultured Microbulbifer sp. TaxID=348147 RepID=UPI0026221B85|nr:hypothetical protein [uncultured Microbulbifer sp.]
MTELDWKIFKEIREKAMDKLSLRALSNISNILNDDTSCPSERCMEIDQLMKSHSSEMDNIFDNLSRSKAVFQLLQIRSKNLVDKNYLERLSAEFLDRTAPRARAKNA